MIERRAMTMERMDVSGMRSVSGVAGLSRADGRAIGIAPATIGATGAQYAAQPQSAVAHEEERSQAAVWFWSVTFAVIVWSVSYLLRQPGVAGSALDEPFSFLGNFALEGMVLALAWLGVLVTACLAVLTGAARIEDPSA
jgi:hypothetical protein